METNFCLLNQLNVKNLIFIISALLKTETNKNWWRQKTRIHQSGPKPGTSVTLSTVFM